MPEQNTITYPCDVCGYVNTWTRGEVVQRGMKDVYRGDDEDHYSLPCKNPTARPRCSGRYVVTIKPEEH